MKKRIAAVCAALMLAVPVQAQAMADSEVYALAEEIGGAYGICRRSHGMRAGTRRMPATEAVRGLCRYRKNGTGTG